MTDLDTDVRLVTRNTKELPQINFGRMIGYYTRDFRLSNVDAAVDYLALICLNADLPGKLGQSQISLCHEALRELILETREFSRLLGDVRSDGSRLQGAIQERLEIIGLANQEVFLKTVTVEAASVADDNGRTTDAVLLYHLAEDYDNVIAIVNRALSEAIAVDIGQERLRLQSLNPGADQRTLHAQQGGSLSLTSVDDPIVLAKNMMALYNNNTLYMSKIKAVNRETCGTLLRMAEAKEKVAARQWIDAITVCHYSCYCMSLLTSCSISRISSFFPWRSTGLYPRSALPQTHSIAFPRLSLATLAPCSCGPSRVLAKNVRHWRVENMGPKPVATIASSVRSSWSVQGTLWYSRAC